MILSFPFFTFFYEHQEAILEGEGEGDIREEPEKTGAEEQTEVEEEEEAQKKHHQSRPNYITELIAFNNKQQTHFQSIALTANHFLNIAMDQYQIGRG